MKKTLSRRLAYREHHGSLDNREIQHIAEDQHCSLARRHPLKRNNKRELDTFTGDRLHSRIKLVDQCIGVRLHMR